MPLHLRQRRPFDRENDLHVQRFLDAQIGRDNARVLLQAVEQGVQSARAEALQDKPEDQRHTFYSCLRRKIHRYLRSLTSTSINVRLALNGGGHEHFLVFQVGNFIGTIGKAEQQDPGYRKALFRTMIQETGRLIYQDDGPALQQDEQTVFGILRWEYDLSEGLPYSPSRVTVSAFKDDGQTLGASINLIDLAAGKKRSAVNPMTEPVMVPAAQHGLFPSMLIDPAFQPTAKRRRDGRRVTTEEEIKSS